MPVIVCNGMNRAGSTLQYNLARSLIEKSGMGQGEGHILREQAAEYRPILQAWANDSRWHVVKSHDLPPEAAALTAAGRMYVCYIYRDIRGVAASYKRVWQVEGDRLLAELDQAIANYYALNGLSGGVLPQKYEQVMADLPGATRQIATFLEVADPSPALIESVTRECSAEAMQKVLRRLDWRLRLQRLLSLPRRIGRRLGIHRNARQRTAGKQRLDPRTLLHPNHISDNGGAADSWRERLSTDEKAFLTERYRAWLEETGYLA